MHLVYHGVGSLQSSSYKNEPALARPYTLAHLFHKLRMNRNLTKGRLAEKFSLSEEYVSAVESGSKFPSAGYCLSCAREFGANPEWVKRMWVREMVGRFQSRLNKRLSIED
jgi:transcriptional regulator with XRE-family HTH domain